LRLEGLKLAPEAFGAKYSDSILIPEAEWQKRVFRYASDKDACNLIAWIDGNAVGMVTFINDGNPSMFQMWVTPSCRKQGIAEKLVGSLKSWAKSAGFNSLVCSVFKSNKAALDLYLRIGFFQTRDDGNEIHLRSG
jgi:ribosomal protein S18 acetylase RimI-like enzyme